MPAASTKHSAAARTPWLAGRNPRHAKPRAATQRWAAAVAAAAYALWVLRLALGVYETEVALAARRRVERPPLVWHAVGTLRTLAPTGVVSASGSASPIFMGGRPLGCAPPPWRPAPGVARCSRDSEPRAVATTRRRGTILAYSSGYDGAGPRSSAVRRARAVQ